MTDLIVQPQWGDVISFQGQDWKELPDVAVPYFAHASNGYFVHRRTAQGRGIIRTHQFPKKLQPLTEYFKFDAPEIPASIYAQAVHFFRRIYDNHHTEAEVLITQHQETKAYRLFVPTQRVAHGGVYSIYNPAHITPGYLIVGTFHSHCDFSPFHSSTDEGDARDMDGIHGTIGYLKRERPEMALMYAINGTFFHFKTDKTDDDIETYSDVVDMTDLNAATAPEWWDRYVLLGHYTDKDRDTIAPYADDDAWERFMGRYHPPKKQTWSPPQTNQQSQTRPTTIYQPWWTGYTPEQLHKMGYVWENETWKWVGHARSQILDESKEFNARFEDHDYGRTDFGYRAPMPRPVWGADGELLAIPDNRATPPPNTSSVSDDPDEQDLTEWREYAFFNGQAEDYWEDMLGKDFVAGLIDTGLVTDDDVDWAVQSFPESGHEDFWFDAFKLKIQNAAEFLRDNGFIVRIHIDQPPKPVPGQTTITGLLESGDLHA